MGHITTAIPPKCSEGACGKRRWNLGYKKVKKCLRRVEESSLAKLLRKCNNVNIQPLEEKLTLCATFPAINNIGSSIKIQV